MSVTVANYDTFNELTKEGLVIVDYYSTTCGPCKLYSKILEQIAYECPFISIVKVNLTDHPKLGEVPAFGGDPIGAVPTSFFVKNGELVCTEVGSMSQDEVMEIIGQYFF